MVHLHSFGSRCLKDFSFVFLDAPKASKREPPKSFYFHLVTFLDVVMVSLGHPCIFIAGQEGKGRCDHGAEAHFLKGLRLDLSTG